MKKLIAVIILAIALLGGGAYAAKITSNSKAITPVSSPSSSQITATIAISDTANATTTTVEAAPSSTLLQAMDALKQSGKIEFTTEASSYGTMVTAINGQKNGTGGKYWLYSVNGQPGSVGADAYKLQSGDKIIWEFKAS